MATLIPPLFPNFLSDHNVCQQAEQYWSEAVTQLLQPHGLSHHPFYTKHFGNGQPIADGNPIFNGYIPGRHKLVRILQYDPTTFEGASIGYYTDTWPTPEMAPDKRPRHTDRHRSPQAGDRKRSDQEAIAWLLTSSSPRPSTDQP
ncbi:MAG: hypothetical protein NXI25_26335 [bacterium]|nr:hypothetical protein [bacterium]